MAFKAKNSSQSARELLVDRSDYDAHIMGENIGEPARNAWETKKIKDFRSNEKIFYGKVDYDNSSVIVRPEFLKPVSKQIDGPRALNFVADAFLDLTERYKKALSSGQVSGVLPVYSSLNAKKAYMSPNKKYLEFTRQIAGDFSSSFVALKNRDAKIKDFKTFLPVFREYLLRKCNHGMPVTKSFFMKTGFVSPLSSGLMIEIHDQEYSNDPEKHMMFYRQKDFQFLKNTAYHFGFVIDKHIPWRLVADIKSPNMLPYLEQNNIIADELFRRVYEPTYLDELANLVRIAASAYNHFVLNYPAFTSGDCGNSKITPRRSISDEEAMAERVDFWIRLWVELANIEIGIGYDEKTVNNIAQNAIDLMNSVDPLTAMSYINDKFNSVEHFGGSLFSDITRRKIAKGPNPDEEDYEEIVNMSVRSKYFKTY